MLRDYEIRTALKQHLATLHESEPDTLILDELGICQGLTRADVAVVNGEISAFEIKSDADSLVRLANQVELYSKVCDRVTLVLGEKHIEGAKQIIPSWWGVWTITEKNEAVAIKKIKKGRINKLIDPSSLVQLLWKEEAYQLLAKYNMANGVKSKPKKVLWDRLVANLGLDVLRTEVRATLKARTDWRVTTG